MIAVLERGLASMRVFILIDLASQADSLPREVREWGNERLVSWFRLFGEVSSRPLWLSDQRTLTLFEFLAPSGLLTRFAFAPDGGLYIMRPTPHQVWGTAPLC